LLHARIDTHANADRVNGALPTFWSFGHVPKLSLCGSEFALWLPWASSGSYVRNSTAMLTARY
jgi:hypothetical protein